MIPELLLGRFEVLHSVQSDISWHSIIAPIFILYIHLFISARCSGAGRSLADADVFELTFVTILTNGAD